ncbi:MAG: 4-hydroxy-tetrahydrodipicolinate synthase [Myxococcales bacterium]|nr:4-hydroxy-tetrahydrodipicolinate synthase [Myxococcales bacterium]
MFEGTYTALITPFRDGALDEEAFRRLIQRQLDGGVEGLVPCGTTGETPTLTDDEYVRVVSIAIEEAAGRVPVIAGTGSNNTKKTIETTKLAKELGADAALIVTPYYNKPPQHALVTHYQAICAEVSIPVVLYNVPGRTGSNLSPESAAELSKLDEIVALKDAAGSMEQTMRTIELCEGRLNVLSGDDALAFPMYALGAKGVISVSSNVDPARMSSIYRAAKAGDFATARRLHYELLPLIRDLFCEANPIPSKAALSYLGYCANELRGPLVPLSAHLEERIRGVLRALELS